MIYKTGSNFFIKGPYSTGISIVIDVVWPWFMPVLFTLAGMSSAYALKKRTPAEYAGERFHKLFVPFFFGVVLIMPIAAYFGAKFNNNYAGTFFGECVQFFSKYSKDLSGYNGEFGVGHLWYVLYLFIISLIALPVMVMYNKSTKKINLQKINLFILLMLFIFPLIGHYIPIIPGKSIFEYLFFFIIGYLILSNDCVVEICEKYRFLLTGIFLLFMLLMIGELAAINNNKIAVSQHRVMRHLFEGVVVEFYAYCGILALLGLTKKYVNIKNKYTDYFAGSSFGVYLFHLPWIVTIAYYVLKNISNVFLQIIIILAGSIILTFVTYEIVRRIPIVNKVFCINHKI